MKKPAKNQDLDLKFGDHVVKKSFVVQNLNFDDFTEISPNKK